MKNSFLTLAILAASSSFQLAHAQREAPDRAVKREQRQQQMQQMTPEARAQFRQQGFEERLKSATPEQREQMMARRAQTDARMTEQGLDPNNPADRQKAMQDRRGNRGAVAPDPAARDTARRALMNASGIDDSAVQDAIIAFMNDEEKARQPLLQLARDVASSLQQNPAPGSDEAVTRQLETYQKALAADKTRHQTALTALDAKISYSTKPRLKAFLNLVGVLDSDALALGGAAAIFTSGAPQNGAPQNAARAARRANRNVGAAAGAKTLTEAATQ